MIRGVTFLALGPDGEARELNDEAEVVAASLDWDRHYRVAETFLHGDEVRVSTVCLKIEHGRWWPGEEPTRFETMVFGGPLDGECERYRTRAEADSGHARWVAKAIAAGTGAAGDES